MVTHEEIATARRFARFFTREADLLDESLSKSDFSLAESRVLYELAHRAEATAAGLSRDLGMDAGYLSRILRRFADRGYLERQRSERDGREARLTLSPGGRSAYAPLDAGSSQDWRQRLEPLPTEDRRRLLDAMASIESLLGRGPAVRAEDVLLRGYQVGDLGWISRRHGMLYAAEYGWDASFEALVAEILIAFVRDHDPACERAWVAEADRAILGSVFLVRESAEVAKLRLLYVEPNARGIGLGRRLMETCIAFARARSYRRVTLWTNDCLVAARQLYVRAGFTLVEEAPHTSFGQDLVGQSWTLDL